MERSSSGAARMDPCCAGSPAHRLATGSTAGDVDHDGRADILIGAGRVDTASGVDSGQVQLRSGADGHVIRTFSGEDAGGRFGSAADLAGDLDHDGQRDFVLGARDSGPFKNGRAYAISAATGRRLWSVTAGKKGGDLGSFFVAGLGDVDRDGTPDVYLGDYLDQTNGGQSGAAFVVSGVDGLPIHAWH